MKTQSIWNTFSTTTNFSSLESNTNADIVIIGGGITGLTNAQLLSDIGFKVIVLEARKICGGTTSHSTGNLYCTIDQRLSTIKNKYDIKMVKKVLGSRRAAIDLIEENIKISAQFPHH